MTAGLTVSRRGSKKATVRNLLKRRAREIFRKNLDKIKAGYDLFFIFSKPAAALSFQELEKEILGELSRFKLLK